jgi:ADP-ribosylglycohydrolase
MRSLNALGRYDQKDFLGEYIAFMTEPDRHNDTYAESFHRDFFANYARGIAPEKCAGAEGHDTASIGGLVGLPMVILATLREGNLATTHAATLAHQRLTHRSESLERYSLALANLMFDIFDAQETDTETLVCKTASSVGFPVEELLKRVRRNQNSDLDVIGGLLSPTCYVDQSFPSVLYLAARYSNDFEGALVGNTNVGGDNCHRGAVLGCVLGAALGFEAIPKRWINGLTAHDEIQEEIEQFIRRFG